MKNVASSHLSHGIAEPVGVDIRLSSRMNQGLANNMPPTIRDAGQMQRGHGLTPGVVPAAEVLFKIVTVAWSDFDQAVGPGRPVVVVPSQGAFQKG